MDLAHARRDLVRRQALFAPRAKLIQRQRRCAFQLDGCAHPLPPLGIIDFDILSGRERVGTNKNKIRSFANNIARRTKNYRIIDFSVFPGSLGNYAGYEHKIPTFTIELTDSDPGNFEKHWQHIKDGLIYATVTTIELAALKGR